MNLSSLLNKLWLPALCALLFLTALYCRPLLPVDETRYMSVAWEMSLRQGWFEPLTMNFEPYSHKPPLLFWLINMFWSVFGVSRWAGMLPPLLSSMACVYLMAYIGRILADMNRPQPSSERLADRTRLMILMAASFPFMIYGTLVMFDFLLTVFVLLSIICGLRYAAYRRLSDLVFLGLCLGFGVLAKGPVAYLYVLPVFLLAPFWKPDLPRLKQWYASLLIPILISAGPVLLWLVPVLKASDNDFAFWLVWNQTAGRITGNFSQAHVRPVMFYLPFIPVAILPWVFFPSVWKFLRKIKEHFKTDYNVRFLLCWFVPVFVAFSLISGKQPHYIVPLVPALIMLVCIAFEKVKTAILVKTLMGVALFFILGQFIAKHALFDKYDLKPVVEVIHQYPDTSMAYVSNYHAELGFLAKRTEKIEDIKYREIGTWFKQHPDGLIIVRHKDASAIREYEQIFNMKYRGAQISVIRLKPLEGAIK